MNEKNMTKLEEFMKTYIKSTVSHVGDNVLAWDVVNEAIDNAKDPSAILKTVSPWYKIDNYICKAFTAAHEANPKALLFYNDYQHASMAGKYKTKSDKVYNYIKQMVNFGCPIHGVGFQSHTDLTYSDEELAGIKGNMQRYHELGILVHITEHDVRC